MLDRPCCFQVVGMLVIYLGKKKKSVPKQCVYHCGLIYCILKLKWHHKKGLKNYLRLLTNRFPLMISEGLLILFGMEKQIIY